MKSNNNLNNNYADLSMQMFIVKSFREHWIVSKETFLQILSDMILVAEIEKVRG